MAASEKARLFSRLHELHTQQGKTWKEIAHILEEEGYEENGKPLTDNALRKRYAKWNKSDTRGTSPTVSELGPKQDRGELRSDQLQGTRMESDIEQFDGSTALPAAPENAIAFGIADLVTLYNRLLEQIQQSHRILERLGRSLGEQEYRANTPSVDMEQTVTSRDLLELLREFGRGQQMKFIEEGKEYDLSREEVQQLIEETVENRVDSELKNMLSEGGSFSEKLSSLIDHRLKTLFLGGEPVPHTPHAGPGRGRKGKSHVKFSASLEENLYARVKSLPGQFSRHLANALSTYLSVMEEKKED
ncbi:MAG: hypothetical protein HY912_20060 [Desulfomonile tiedjei]|uniref:Uncharacterized protein n=1 Tax=Desulfomonile tiedjei TaxID=2358 RepID=A0A9D6V5C1_9BACT|nr:hypothetical protein [Desulfomonile tiedjei]